MESFMKKIKALPTLLLCFSSISTSYACGVQGTAVNSDGSKINGTATVSTSWNSEKAFPKNGSYSLDLGASACGKRITVYLDGNNRKSIRVDGWTTVDFVRR